MTAELPVSDRRLADDLDALTELRGQAVELIDTLSTPITRVTLRVGDVCLELECGTPQLLMPSAPSVAAVPAPITVPPVLTAVPAPEAGPDFAESGAWFVTAPLVGIFHCSPSPGAPPFVTVGERVAADQPLAIVEAMKLMNELTADHAAVIAEVMVSNGEWVEFDQPLFRLIAAPTDAEL